jgi:hypothetical protein
LDKPIHIHAVSKDGRVCRVFFHIENKEIRDCDIKWLNDKLYKFTQFAAETLGKKFGKIDLVSNDGLLNEYKTGEFLKAFRTLLNYFKTF